MIPIVGGVVGLLMAQGVIPRDSKNPERSEQWRRKFGRTMTVISPLLIVWGTLNLFGVIPEQPKPALEKPKLKIDAKTGLPEGMTVHRSQAGTPDDNGWYFASSTEGGFSVRLPVPFDDFTTKTTASSGSMNEAYVIRSRSIEGLKFIVVEMKNDEDLSPEVFVERMKSDLFGRPKHHAIDGYRSVDLQTRQMSNGSGAYSRLVKIGPHHTIMMILEYPVLQAEAASELVSTFFDSIIINVRE